MSKEQKPTRTLEEKQTLRAAFEKHLGRSVLDPDRMTRDVCAIEAELSQLASAHSLKIRFDKVNAGMPPIDDQDTVGIFIVPNKRGAWTIRGFDIL